MKQLRRNITFGLLSAVIATASSCQTNGKNTLINQVSGNIPVKLAESLQSIGQGIQQRIIDPTKDNLIKGKNGTVIYINANSFVDEAGVPVSSKTIVELKEHYSIADYITSNLQTVHHTDILQTQGMIYFSAKTADGKAVKINKSKPVRIEFPVSEQIASTKIFTGKRDKNGHLNWSEVNEPSKSLVPYPIRFISQSFFSTECPMHYGITKDTLRNGSLNYYSDLSKFENTFLATREFKERYDVACWKEVVKIYIENIDRNLWEADEMVVKYFIKDSTERVNFEIKDKPVGENGGAPTKEQKAVHKQIINQEKAFGHRMIKLFHFFAGQRMAKVDASRKINDTTFADLTKAFVAYDALEFGWVNVDRFYKDPKSVETKLIAKTNEFTPLINLIIPQRKVILSGIRKDDNTYSFTKNESGYNKLPKGEKAFIIAISIVDNKLHFAEKEIVIGQNETERIELKATTAEAMKKRMKNYGS